MFKALKKQLSEEEEAFNLIKRKYPHLTNMSDEDILLYCECRSISDIVQYVKQLKTNLVLEKNNGEISCTCTDASGNPKNLYMNRKEAEQVSVQRKIEQNITLKMYACPTSRGWHLTKE